MTVTYGSSTTSTVGTSTSINAGSITTGSINGNLDSSNLRSVNGNLDSSNLRSVNGNLSYTRYLKEKHNDDDPALSFSLKVLLVPGIEKIIFNPPATIVLWDDGVKTVVKASNEEFSEEHGLAMAIARRYFHGSRSAFKKAVKNASRPYEQVPSPSQLSEAFKRYVDEVQSSNHLDEVFGKWLASDEAQEKLSKLQPGNPTGHGMKLSEKDISEAVDHD